MRNSVASRSTRTSMVEAPSPKPSPKPRMSAIESKLPAPTSSNNSQLPQKKSIIKPTSSTSFTSTKKMSVGTFFTEMGESDLGSLMREDSMRTEATSIDQEEEEEEIFDIPPDLDISKEEVEKYFGKVSRKKFFEQLSQLQRQKTIIGSNHADPLSVNLLNLLNRLEEEKRREAAKEAAEVKFDTKIVIRTQSLNPTELYDQMRLVQKPSTYLTTLSEIEYEEEEALSQRSHHSLTDVIPAESASLSNPSTASGKGKRPPLASPVKLKPLTISTPSTEINGGKTSSAPSNEGRPSNPRNHKLTPIKTATPSAEGDDNKVRRKRTTSQDNNDSRSGIQGSGSASKSMLVPQTSKDARHPSDENKASSDPVKEEGLIPDEPLDRKPSIPSISLPPLSVSPGPSSGPASMSSPFLSPAKLEFVCIDHRDAYNQKVNDRLKKSSSLFQYVESKQIKREFYDDYADDAELDEELSLLKNHQLPSPVSTASSQGRRRASSRSVSRSKARTVERDAFSIATLESLEGSGNGNGSLSPRSLYIDNCIRHRLNPRAGLILRKRFTRELNLKHLGMGDKMAVLLAEAIVNVPYIRSLNVRDNNLDDEGLSAIVNSIIHMKDLVELDMSYNMIGPSAASALANYLSRPECPLKRLILQKADVDDDECRDFVSSLEHNTCLEELDLSENLVGSSENLNTVMPDLTTGGKSFTSLISLCLTDVTVGEALADLLKTPSCPLKTLKLGWNLIRLDGAVTLCQSLAFNTSLTHLELSFNSLSSNGGIALGDALQDNKVLKTLHVSNNSLDSVACLTICAGIFQNEALESVSFNENPIGEQGAKVLMLLPTIIGSRVHVMARNCNLQIKDPKNWFDSAMLIRDYHLHLDNPFDRAVAIILSYLIPAHQTYIIAHSEYFDPDAKKWVDLQLKEAVDTEYYKKRPLSPEQLKVIEGLQRIQAATADIGKAVELFKMVDEDGSGELDAEEFAKLIEAVGMDPSKSAEIMAEYDVDGGGVIEIAEFLLFLKTQRKESRQRLQELTEYPILYSALHFPEGESKRSRYVPPRKGQLKLSIIDGFTQKPTYRVISPEDRTNILKVAEESGDLLTMTSFGVKNYKIRLYEALSLASSLMKDSDKVQVLGTVLPQMSHSTEAKILVNRIIDANVTDFTRLKRLIGQFYRVIMGTPDGYYSLDLSSEMDRCCVNRLLEISMTMKHFRSAKRNVLGYGKLGDTSQKNNFSCFRNEMLNRRPVTVTTDFASPLPRAGRLEFDFVSQKRYSSDSFIINDVRFTNLLMKTFQLHKSDRTKVLKLLSHTKKQCGKTIHGNARRIYEIPKEKAMEIGLAVEAFYLRLPERLESIEKFRSRENVKVIWEFDPNKIQLRYNNFHRIYNVPPVSDVKYQMMMAHHQPQQQGNNKGKKGGGSSGKAGGGSGKVETVEVVEEEEEVVWSSEEEEEEEEEGEGELDVEKRGSLSDDEEKNVTEEEKMEELFRQQMPAMERASMGEAATLLINMQHQERASDTPVTPTTALVTEAAAKTSSMVMSQPKMMSEPRQPSRGNKKKQAPLAESLNRYVCLMASRNIPLPTKAAKTLELLLDTFETVSLMMRHLEIIVILFEELGSQKTSEYFGTYRVELIIQLFSNIVDVYNIELLYRHLSAFEIACLYCRLGYLNLFNPMKPEGSYSFDLSRHEERAVVKMLAHLAVIEPGDNLPFVQFRWEREMDCMPGYELTELWMTESGMPKKGIWDCTYYAGEGRDLNGCKPHIKCRKGLLQLVFVEEDEMMTEEDREAETKIVPVGPQYVQANQGTFIGYLAYNEEDFAIYQEKHKGGEKKDDKGKKKK